MSNVSDVTNDDAITNASTSASTMVNNDLDDDCVTNSSRKIGLEPTYNEIELWMLSSSSIPHQQQKQEKEKEQFSHAVVDSNNARVSNDNIRNEH